MTDQQDDSVIPSNGRAAKLRTEGSGFDLDASVYLSAVRGRAAFREAYRRCLPVVRAAEALASKWATAGQQVDSDYFYAAVNAVFEAVAARNSATFAPEDRTLAAVSREELGATGGEGSPAGVEASGRGTTASPTAAPSFDGKGRA